MCLFLKNCTNSLFYQRPLCDCFNDSLIMPLQTSEHELLTFDGSPYVSLFTSIWCVAAHVDKHAHTTAVGGCAINQKSKFSAEFCPRR